MKVVLYMGQTLNGYIAKLNDDTSFLTKASSKGFIDNVRKAGNAVIGRRTFEVSLPVHHFPFGDVLNVVMTTQKIENKWGNKAIFTDKSPKNIVKMLKDKGFETILVGGGGVVCTSFLEAGLADEIYVDIEPVIFGRGKKIFADGDFENKLKLMEPPKKLSPSELQLHYKILK